MKVFIFSKRSLFVFCLIIFIITLFFLWLNFKSSPSLAVALDYNCIISDAFRNNIQNLTKGEEKIAYLTFDDGPNPSVTPKILDILKKENINNEIGACVYFKSFGLRIAKKSDGKISRIEVIRAIH